MNTTKRLLLDVGMFGALLVAANPVLTGLAIHEWLSIAIIVPLLMHTIINWDWTVRTATRFIERLRHMSRVNLVVDALLFVSAVAVMLSGFAVSQVALAALGFATQLSAVWIALHSASADATVALLLVHFALHGRWVLNAVRRWMGEGAGPATLRQMEES